MRRVFHSSRRLLVYPLSSRGFINSEPFTSESYEQNFGRTVRALISAKLWVAPTKLLETSLAKQSIISSRNTLEARQNKTQLEDLPDGKEVMENCRSEEVGQSPLVLSFAFNYLTARMCRSKPVGITRAKGSRLFYHCFWLCLCFQNKSCEFLHFFKVIQWSVRNEITSIVFHDQGESCLLQKILDLLCYSWIIQTILLRESGCQIRWYCHKCSVVLAINTTCIREEFQKLYGISGTIATTSIFLNYFQLLSLTMAEFTLETSNPSWTGFSSETSFPS